MYKENPQAKHTADNGNDFIADVSGSLDILNEALAFIQQAEDEYRTYYSRIDGKVKEVSELVSNLADVIENYR